MIYKDNGYGVPVDSKKFVEAQAASGNLDPEKVKEIKLIRGDYKYTVRIIMRDDEFWTSGFNWGYGGSGPHGLLWLIEKLGFQDELGEDIIMDRITGMDMDSDYIIRKDKGVNLVVGEINE